ncbi:50S ribosomal protein L9 [Candidatus Uhrbacteria bacterium CG_4_9_14_3_um_filter_41_35]|uniref:Large ribosomal subunit protein bL9 n=1 Tax=Candidatus Uhrbacteria bacterium CG_4_9_14_3_um_filter_41_35 TaxID=1975034 RepID=A0A2M7XD05_9BACT|nr:MAG: 50S ribosomal protein L9 [Candidatus Uhrbacteria bacterium CG11_big_fil_rev_8_21_14_0_20_41_9]PJA45749.1 MAG: 50S ribosomal protein L9 [Candidatus Uhrbacteria bacterium CG_4_9_14_3_um_filter_41_35]
MKVILLENVKSLGNKGDVAEVSEGYARNFLFPQHIAIEASEQTLREKNEKEQTEIRRSKKIEQEEKKKAKVLDGFEVFIKVKTDGGKLYASVGPNDIAEALKETKHKIEPELIKFKPVKELGTYEAVVEFASGFDATLTVVIEEK